MKFQNSKLYQIVKEEVNQMLSETFPMPGPRLSVHPFANHMADQPDRTLQQNLYDELADATIMEMVSAYSEDQIREIVRSFTIQASQGPGGIGGKFSDEEVDEVLMLVYEKVKEKTGVELGSYMPNDREHPKYMDVE